MGEIIIDTVTAKAYGEQAERARKRLIEKGFKDEQIDLWVEALLRNNDLSGMTTIIKKGPTNG